MNSEGFLSLFKEKGWPGLKKALRLSFPYLILFLASLTPFMILYTGEGYAVGHDWVWHVVYSYDLMAGYQKHIYTLSPNHYFFGSLGYNAFLFYASFPEVLVASFTALFRPLGASITLGMKVVTIGSVFLSGVWAYKLGKRISKSELGGLGFGLCYVFFPYRIFNFLARVAFCEAVALAFPPLLFLGIYGILHDERNRASSYVRTAFGAALLVLSHPFTALTVILAALLFILFSFREFPRLFRQKSTYVYAPLTILCIIGLIAFYFFPMEEATRSGLFRISDEKAVWTDLESVLAHQDDQFFKSGILNFYWLAGMRHDVTTDSSLSWTLELVFFPALSLGAIALRLLGERYGKKWLGFGLGILPIAALFLVARREEAYLCAGLLALCYLGSALYKKEEQEPWSREGVRNPYLSLLKSPELYALGIVLLFAFLWLFNPGIWYLTPGIFRKAQFPFRFWGVIGFILPLLVFILLSPLLKKKGIGSFSLAMGSIALLLCNGPVDKRINAQNGATLGQEYSVQQIYELGQIGVMNEYIPNVFYDDDHRSVYQNSLYREVFREVRITHDYSHEAEGYKMAFLKGKGSYKVTGLDSPLVSFSLTLKEDSFIQMKQFYYPGYKLQARDENDSVKTPEIVEVDGLLAFRLPKGVYTCDLTYPGPRSYRVSLPFLPISVGVLLGMLAVDESRKARERIDASYSVNLPKREGNCRKKINFVHRLQGFSAREIAQRLKKKFRKGERP